LFSNKIVLFIPQEQVPHSDCFPLPILQDLNYMLHFLVPVGARLIDKAQKGPPVVQGAAGQLDPEG
jgi:hypothetical protein